jgi:hypothetical protein
MRKNLWLGYLAISSSILLSSPPASAQKSTISDYQSYEATMERETGLPGFPLPKNIPSQAPPHNNLTHCGIGYGYASNLSIFLTKPECETWLRDYSSYSKKYGTALIAYDARKRNAQNAASEARRQEEVGSGRKLIYALFLCIPTTGTCEMQGQSRVTFAGVVPDMTFRSLANCEQYAQRATGLVTPPTRGRFLMPSGMWMECRGRQIDTWKSLY